MSGHALKAGDKVKYFNSRWPGLTQPATVLRVTKTGRLSLNVYQGGAVPYYTATGVQATSVHLVERAG